MTTPPEDTVVLPPPAPEPRAAGPRGLVVAATAIGLVLLGAIPTYAITKAANDDDNPQNHLVVRGQGRANDERHRFDGDRGQGRGQGRFMYPPGQQGQQAPGLRPRVSQECLDALQELREGLTDEVTPETLPRLSDDQRERLRTVCLPQGRGGQAVPAPGTTPAPNPTPSATPGPTPSS